MENQNRSCWPRLTSTVFLNLARGWDENETIRSRFVTQLWSWKLFRLSIIVTSSTESVRRWNESRSACLAFSRLILFLMEETRIQVKSWQTANYRKSFRRPPVKVPVRLPSDSTSLDSNAAVERPPRVLKLVGLFFSSSSNRRLVIWTTVSNEELHIYRRSSRLVVNERKLRKREYVPTLISSKVTGCVR